MAGKDITIPFGPDRTGGVELIPDPNGPAEGTSVQSSQDPFDDIARPDGEGGSPQVQQATAEFVEVPQVPVIDVPSQAADAERPTRRRREAAQADEEAAAQGMDDVQMSFLALKNSIGQGRELRARGKERDEFVEKLDVDRAELADREYILANYAAVVAEQDDIIARHTQQRDARKSELAQVAADKDEASEALGRMREYHAMQMEPLERELGHARASADQAKNDERSRKSELSAAESELKRAEEGEGRTLAAAQHAQVEAAYEEARARSESAKEHLAQVQKTYDDARARIEQEEGPLERQVEDLGRHENELKDSIARLAEEISTAQHRRQYCDSVYQYPDETAKLRESVEAGEEQVRKMDAEYDALGAQLAQSKAASKKAKVAIGILVAIVVIVAIVWLIVGAR